MKIEGAIFDMDGTLLDSMWAWRNVGENYLNSKGISYRGSVFEQIKDMSIKQSAKFFQDKYGVTDDCDTIIADINKLVENFYVYEVELKWNVPSLLERLKKAGVKMCVATATDLPLVEAALKRCNIRQYFGEIFTCSSVGHGKNKPDIYNIACEFLKTQKENTWVFEDALYAIKTAKNAGYKVVGIFDDFEPEHDAVEQLSDIYISSPEEMEELFK